LIPDIRKEGKKEEGEMEIKNEMIFEINNLITEGTAQEGNTVIPEETMTDGMISIMIEEKKTETMDKKDSKEVESIEVKLKTNNLKGNPEKWIENNMSKKNNNFDGK
jgi:hypothetical protein